MQRQNSGRFLAAIVLSKLVFGNHGARKIETMGNAFEMSHMRSSGESSSAKHGIDATRTLKMGTEEGDGNTQYSSDIPDHIQIEPGSPKKFYTYPQDVTIEALVTLLWRRGPNREEFFGEATATWGSPAPKPSRRAYASLVGTDGKIKPEVQALGLADLWQRDRPTVIERELKIFMWFDYMGKTLSFQDDVGIVAQWKSLTFGEPKFVKSGETKSLDIGHATLYTGAYGTHSVADFAKYFGGEPEVVSFMLVPRGKGQFELHAMSSVTRVFTFGLRQFP